MGSKNTMDPWMLFAESLRSKGGVENRAGVLDAERFDLFRGKDFVRWVKANPAKCTAVAAGKVVEGDELAKYLGQQLIRKRLALRVDRLNKKPLPGSKRMVKFPRKLAPLPPDQASQFAEDGFYIWLYERPTSVWTYVWIALIPLVVLGACLFPLAPNWAKIAVFYLSSGLLALLLGSLLLRGAVAAATWIVSGHTLWLLPNIMSEELPISQIFKPLVSLQRPAEGASRWSNHPLTRLAVGAALAGLLYVLYRQSPDAASLTTEATRYRDDLMDWLGVQREGYQRISSSSAAAAANATDGGLGAKADAAPAPEPAADAQDVQPAGAAADEVEGGPSVGAQAGPSEEAQEAHTEL